MEDENEVEKLIDEIFRPGGQVCVFDSKPANALEKAQRIVWDAFAERKRSKRIALAEKALNASRDCADAYVLLSEERRSLKDKIVLLRKGVEAGKRALGSQLANCTELSWQTDMKARPYLRALSGLACALLQDEQISEGIELSKEVLRLDRLDHQGTRINLATILTKHNRDEELEQLFKQFSMECSAHMLFTRALFVFKKHGAGPLAFQALKEASSANPHVLGILGGDMSELTLERPTQFEPGTKEEAQHYLASAFKTWCYIEGATEWLCHFVDSELDHGEGRLSVPPKTAYEPFVASTVGLAHSSRLCADCANTANIKN